MSYPGTNEPRLTGHPPDPATDDIPDERVAIWVCVDCYFAHHYGAHSVEREPTDHESNMRALHTSRPLAYQENRDLIMSVRTMGLEFLDDGQVREWFAGESDQRCEGGEPLGLIGDGFTVFDWTCSNHDVTDTYDDDGDRDGDTTKCPHCNQTGHEDGITEFSWSSCDGCGSHLGGSRHRLSLEVL
jgi:ribosomal protein L37AE/L43A